MPYTLGYPTTSIRPGIDKPGRLRVTHFVWGDRDIRKEVLLVPPIFYTLGGYSASDFRFGKVVCLSLGMRVDQRGVARLERFSVKFHPPT